MKSILIILLSVITHCVDAQISKKQVAIQDAMIISKKQVKQFHDGENVAVSKDNYSIIAQVKNKRIEQWLIREKNGKEYLAESITKSQVQKKKKKNMVEMEPICIYCFYVQCCGWVCIQTYNNCR